MTFKLPATWMGEPVKGSLIKLLGDEQNEKKPVSKRQVPSAQTAPEKDGFVYVPSIKLYVAKERTLQGKNWNQAHRGLQRQGNQMLTIPQFFDFVSYLQGNSSACPERDQILDEILTHRYPWRSEWLDAKFFEKDGEMYIDYNHRIVGKRLTPQDTKKLEDCLRSNGHFDVSSLNNQGMPTKGSRKQDVYFYSPTDGAVAGFVAGSEWAILNCGRNPAYTNSLLGVRVAREKI